MKWYRVEDDPVESDEYVLVSRRYKGQRYADDCFIAFLIAAKSSAYSSYWMNCNREIIDGALPTDCWCHIDLPED